MTLTYGPRFDPAPGEVKIVVEVDAQTFGHVLIAFKPQPADASDAALLGDECRGRVARSA
ncbi:MAG: hypothetical protein ACJA1L_002473, partial [Paracoccaceae bacterium]